MKKIGCKVITAFTATASPEVLSRVGQVLFDGEAHVVRSDSDRPNIHYYVRKVSSKKQAAILLAKTEPRPMIIFCGTRKRTEDMARDLNLVYGKGTSRFYHAGLEREEKTEIEKWFFEQKDAVLCATCAYGMGVDKKDIHTVVHLDPPMTAEAYIQEAGRGGRDGSVANAILLWNQEDSLKFAQFKDSSRNAVLRRFALGSLCRRQVLLDALGAEKAVCDGCDVCDRKKLLSKKKNTDFLSLFNELKSVYKAQKGEDFIPGDGAIEDERLVLSLIRFGNKYYTEQTLEKAALKLLNDLSRNITGVNIWWNEAFKAIFEGLLSKHKIKICSWPWKDKIMYVSKKNRRRNRLWRIVRLYVIRQKLYRKRQNSQLQPVRFRQV